jgi:hypothetical protein
LKIPIPEINIELQKKFDDKMKKIKDDKNIKIIFNTDELKSQLESIDENEANRILFWINQTKDTLCDSIKKFFEAKGLLYKDENCGTSRKKNKTANIEEEGEGGVEETKG